MYLRSTLAVLLLLGLALLPAPARAQDSEDAEEESGFGHIVVELSTWIAQPAGLGYSPASRHDPGNLLTTDVLSPQIGTRSKQYTKVGYVMPGRMGTLMLSFYDHSDDEPRLGVHDPGNFIYGESLAFPLFAGFAYDGRADFFESTFSTQLTDFRLDLVRKAFERPKVSADWFVGVRRVKHRRNQDARYIALIPNLPALLPPFGGPFPALNPAEETASMGSSFTGRGLEAGMDFKVPLLRDRLSLEAGFTVGLIRGDVEAVYRSLTRYYVLKLPGSETLILPPFAEFEQTRTDPNNQSNQIPLAANIEQRPLQIGLAPSGISTSSEVIETRVGLRWKAWKDFTVSLGFRSARYSDVGMDLRPRVGTIIGVPRIVDGELIGLNLESIGEVRRSVTYEGVYIGVGYKY